MWDFSPEVFWRMHPTEFNWLLEVRRPRRMYGSMTGADVAAIYEQAYGADSG